MSDPFDYLDSRDTADELIQDFGATAAVRRTMNSGSEFEPSQSSTDYGTFAVKIEFTWKQLQGGDVLATDERWLVAAGPLAGLGVTSIQPSDALVIGGTVKPVLVAKPLAPAGTSVMFDCQIRY